MIKLWHNKRKTTRNKVMKNRLVSQNLEWMSLKNRRLKSTIKNSLKYRFLTKSKMTSTMTMISKNTTQTRKKVKMQIELTIIIFSLLSINFTNKKL